MTLQDLIDLSPGEFEVFVTNLLRKMGYKAETTLPQMAGADVTGVLLCFGPCSGYHAKNLMDHLV